MKAIIFIMAFIFSIQIHAQSVPLVTNTTAGLQDIYFHNNNTGISAGTAGKIIVTSNSGLTWFNAASCGGVYYYTLISENFKQTKRTALIK